MQPTLALTAIEAVRADHNYGHTCTDGKWWNPNAGSRSRCPALLHLNTAVDQVTRLGAQVHDAAHTDRHVNAVAAALVATPLGELDEENRAIWVGLARQAIEALAASLDGTDQLADRARATAERLTNADL